MKKPLFRITIGPYNLRGGGTTIELLITEKKRDGRRYLTLQQPVRVAEGDVLNIIRLVTLHPGILFMNRQVKKILGTVKVMRIIGEGRIEVRLLGGKFFGGTCVERTDIQSINI